MLKKICSICNTEFKPKAPGSKYCSKKCKNHVVKEGRKKYREKNREKIILDSRRRREELKLTPKKLEKYRATRKIWIKKNRETINKYAKEYKLKNYEKDKDQRQKYQSEYNKKYYQKNKIKIKAQTRKYSLENYYKQKKSPEAKEVKNKRRRFRKKTDPEYKMIENLRVHLNQAMERENFAKSQKTIKYLGVKLKYLRKYLEHKFQKGMNWDNYGKVWHLDHIIPLSIFDFSKEENIKFAFHYRNLQPMFARENIQKSNKVFVPAEKGDKLRDMDTKINNILKRVHPDQELDFNIITTPIDKRGRGVEIILK